MAPRRKVKTFLPIVVLAVLLPYFSYISPPSYESASLVRILWSPEMTQRKENKPPSHFQILFRNFF